jgi:hypothetical protein
MAEVNENGRISISRLIFVPALITLAVTILRVIGELQHWPKPWFNSAAGGGGAIVGISWLPLIFGPYFAVKLAHTGDRPASMGKAILMAVIGLVVLVAGGICLGYGESHPAHMTVAALGGMIVMLIAGFVATRDWSSLSRTLLAYAFAARIPVAIVMLIAMSANGGQGWGTHYDLVPPAFATAPVLQRWIMFGLLPQMTLWIGFTMVVGALIGAIAVALTVRRPVAQPV